MTTNSSKTTIQGNAEREPTLFDSLSRLVPEELQTAYYRVLAHTRTLSPDDEMMHILEAMGVLAMITRQTPRDIADERERIQEILDLHWQFSQQAHQKMLEYADKLESRLSALPNEIEAGLDPQQIAKTLGESLRQHFLQSGIPDTVKALQSTSSAMISAQKELSAVLRDVSNTRSGVVAQVETANSQLAHSLERRTKTMDALLHEWKSDLLRIWIPMVAAASMLIGIFGAIEIQGCRDSTPAAASTSSQTAAPTAASRELHAAGDSNAKPEPQQRSRENTSCGREHK